jgi:catechol 2,3-dioxygenase-like lactoylglutathione lyase family enzyme
MAVLDHTIAGAHNPDETGRFYCEILAFDPPVRLGPFTVVAVGENTTIDFIEVDGDIASTHFAFLVTEAEFDEVFGRIRGRDLPYWADPGRSELDSINTWDGGRGVYFDDPNGHLLEIITRPYGSGGTTTERPHPLVR